jgi:hypothetical protein
MNDQECNKLMPPLRSYGSGGNSRFDDLSIDLFKKLTIVLKY